VRNISTSTWTWLKLLRQQVRRELLVESRKHTITAKLRQIPCVGPIRAALLVALIQTPHRFRTKRQPVGLQRTGLRNPSQRRALLRKRPAATLEETGFHPRTITMI
jgi:hypothetical protein